MTPIRLICIALIIASVTACLKPPDYALEPQIEFVSLSKNIMQQGTSSQVDSLVLVFSFTDGDGDVGSESIVVIDNRTGNNHALFNFPDIPPQGKDNGISGEVELDFPTTCCIVPNQFIACERSTDYPRDTVTFDIYIKDRAGNESNRITTPPIVLLCE